MLNLEVHIVTTRLKLITEARFQTPDMRGMHFRNDKNKEKGCEDKQENNTPSAKPSLQNTSRTRSVLTVVTPQQPP
jgi:hypothetical protein